MTLFKNKYRIPSTRLPNWDYGNVGFYFVTICTKNRECFFGEIQNNEMILSRIGEIVAEEWLKTEIVRKNVTLNEWIIMPNHIHIILRITKKLSVETSPSERLGQDQKTINASKKWSANTLGSIIGQFKGKCTKRIRAEGYQEFAWQPRFYDRIIRDEIGLINAQYYVKTNPQNWGVDQDNLMGLLM